MRAQIVMQAAIEADVPCLIWSAPGQAKTSLIQEYARLTNRACFVLIGETLDSCDIAGIPRVLSSDEADYVPLRLIARLCASDCPPTLLFLDELTCARPSVQAALLALVNERRAGLRYLSNNVRIVAAANPPRFTPAGWELSPATCNRFVHIEWDYSYEEWLAFASGTSVPFANRIAPEGARWSEMFVQMLRARQSYARVIKKYIDEVATSNETLLDRAYPTPRSLSLFLRLLDSVQTLVLPLDERAAVALECAAGTIGSALATELIELVRELVHADPALYTLCQDVLDAYAHRDARMLARIHAQDWPRVARAMARGDARAQEAITWAARELVAHDVRAIVAHVLGKEA